MEFEKKLFTSEFIDKLIERISDKVAEKIAEYIYKNMFKKDDADKHDIPGILNPVEPVPFDYPSKRYPYPEKMTVVMYGVVPNEYQNISAFRSDMSSYTDATFNKQNETLT